MVLTAPVQARLSPRERVAVQAAVVRAADDDEPTLRRPLTLRELLIMHGGLVPSPDEGTDSDVPSVA